MIIFTVLYPQDSVSKDSSSSSVSYSLSSPSFLMFPGSKIDILYRAKHSRVIYSQCFDQ